MEINCPICGEPWDIDTLHEEVEFRISELPQGHPDRLHSNYSVPFGKVQSDFYSRGCAAFTCCVSNPCQRPEGGSFKAMASSALMDILGDDIDGIAAMLEDFNEDL